MDEDKLFINAWLNVSNDPIVGVDQKGDDFWLRIKKYYDENLVNEGEGRVGALNSRWTKMQ